MRQAGAVAETGRDFTLSGALNPPVTYPMITLRVTGPDDTVTDTTVQQSDTGTWETTRNFFTKNGFWKFKAYWPGNSDHIGGESSELTVPVGVDYGRVIILGGGMAQQSNTYWEATKRFCTDVYRNFGRKGFTKDMIHFLINSDIIDIDYDDQADDVVDIKQPTPETFTQTIENRFASILNADTPLFIYMQGHGTDDARFKVLGNDEFIRADEIGQALDTLQNRTDCKVILILESCYSGNFIPHLSGPNRVILTSSGGEPYNTDASGNISFSRFLFSKLLEGDSLKKAFESARKEMTATGYPKPNLDDNGDGKATDTDGLLASNIHLNGVMTWGLKPEISSVNVTQVLENKTFAPISVSVIPGDTATQKVWVQLIRPDADITGGETTVTYPEIELTFDSASGQYKGTLTGLYSSGLWKAAVQAEEADHDISDPEIVYISVSGNAIPGDVDGSGSTDLADAVLALKICTDADISGQNINTDASIGNNSSIGMEETVYILREIAGQ